MSRSTRESARFTAALFRSPTPHHATTEEASRAYWYDVAKPDIHGFAAIASKHTKLTHHPTTNTYSGRCPFPDHRDENPSFNIFRGKSGDAMGKCHGCGWAGDAIKFRRDIENVSFREAARGLANDHMAAEERREARAHEHDQEVALRRFVDRNPDTPPEAWAFVDKPAAVAEAKQAAKDASLDDLAERVRHRLRM